MKKVALSLLAIYQIILSPALHTITGSVHACRYPISCSEYAQQAITKYGALKGSFLALKRLLSCHPFAKVTPHQV